VLDEPSKQRIHWYVFHSKMSDFIFTLYSGAAFHCYAGSVDAQQQFINAYPNKEVYFTECTGTTGTDWWGNIKWNMNNL
jgi:O-glycosyl hydrolase